MDEKVKEALREAIHILLLIDELMCCIMCLCKPQDTARPTVSTKGTTNNSRYL
ncbi:UNVERIFIED_CONTAM: hypothetical protein ABIC26_002699 [Paenibacillus sp. PvR008]